MPTETPEQQEQRSYEAARRRRMGHDGRQRSALRLHGLLRSAIRSGQVPPRTQLVEEQLVVQYGMSRNAVRRALGLLTSDGLVSRGPRHGTVVVGRIASLALDDPRGEDPEQIHSYDIVLVEEQLVPATPLLAAKLETDATHVRMCERICYRFGQAYGVHTTYWLPEMQLPPPSIDDTPDRGFHELFEEFHGVALGRVDYSIESVLCDSATAKALVVAEHTPLLFLERVQVDVDGRPREYSHTHYIATQIALTFSSGFAQVRPRA